MAKRQRKYKIEIQGLNKSIITIEPPFSIDFDVNKARQSSVCSGSITVYNLGKSTRDSIYKDMLQFEEGNIRTIDFHAGYESDPTLYRVFKGTVQHCYSYRQGVDFLTVIEFNSRSDLLRNATVSEFIPAGTTFQDAMLALSRKVLVDGDSIVGNIDGAFKRGTVLHGNIDKLIKEYACGKFYIDDGNFICIKENEYLTGILNVINSESGLLNSPQREETFLSFDIMFEPRLLMDQFLELSSSTNAFFNGNYKVVGFHHVGTISESICGTAKTTVRVSALGTDGKLVVPK